VILFRELPTNIEGISNYGTGTITFLQGNLLVEIGFAPTIAAKRTPKSKYLAH
jgi:L-lactate permease